MPTPNIKGPYLQASVIVSHLDSNSGGLLILYILSRQLLQFRYDPIQLLNQRACPTFP
jgi:hypothetical protein